MERSQQAKIKPKYKIGSEVKAKNPNTGIVYNFFILEIKKGDNMTKCSNCKTKGMACILNGLNFCSVECALKLKNCETCKSFDMCEIMKDQVRTISIKHYLAESRENMIMNVKENYPVYPVEFTEKFVENENIKLIKNSYVYDRKKKSYGWGFIEVRQGIDSFNPNMAIHPNWEDALNAAFLYNQFNCGLSRDDTIKLISQRCLSRAEY